MKKNNQNFYLVKTGKNLAYWRAKRKMTQEQLEGELGLSDGAISRYETAAHQMSLTTMYRIAEVLQISPNDLSPEEIVVNAMTQPNTGINFKFYRLSEENQKLIEQLIDQILCKNSF